MNWSKYIKIKRKQEKRIKRNDKRDRFLRKSQLKQPKFQNIMWHLLTKDICKTSETLFGSTVKHHAQYLDIAYSIGGFEWMEQYYKNKMQKEAYSEALIIIGLLRHEMRVNEDRIFEEYADCEGTTYLACIEYGMDFSIRECPWDGDVEIVIGKADFTINGVIDEDFTYEDDYIESQYKRIAQVISHNWSAIMNINNKKSLFEDESQTNQASRVTKPEHSRLSSKHTK